ncbi:MAG: hypothetical protein GY700_01660 [Propionibacteriaceae bacterium]|nr:hypothetical protein [Propionibacteriaceae bacterium]
MEYSKIKALNWSSLKPMAESALHCQWLRCHPRVDTEALRLGTVVHMAVLEPDRYETECVRRPNKWDSWRTKASKEWRQDQIDAAMWVLTDDEADRVDRMVDAISRHSDAVRLLSNTRTEEAITWEIDGVPCKGRVDAISADRVVDLKTCRDLGLFVRRDAASMLYHGQLAWYLDGAIAAGACSPDAAAYVVPVESDGPYDCAALRLSERSLDAGRRLWRRLLDEWITCRDTGLWLGRYPSEDILDMPLWAPGMYDDDEEVY